MSQAQLSAPARRRALVAVTVGTAVITTSPGLVAVALPDMAHGLGVGIGAIAWVHTVYHLTIVGLIVPFGGLADWIGRRACYAGGLLLFSLGALSALFAGSLALVLVTRVVQGVGAAMAIAINRSILASAYPTERLGRAMSGVQAGSAAGSVVALAFGGLVVSALGWPAVFAVMAGAGLVGAVVAATGVPADRSGSVVRTRPNWGSAALVVVASVGLMYLISEGARPAASGAGLLSLIALVLTVVALLGFATNERYATHRLVDPALIRDTGFGWSAGSALLSQLVRSGFVFVLGPFYFTQIFHTSAGHLGLVLMVVPLLEMLVAPVSGAWADRSRPTKPAAWGMTAVGLGLLVLVLAPALPAGLAIALVGLAVVGTGFGLFHSANNTMAMASVPSGQLNLAASLLAICLTFGMGTGAAIAGAVLGTPAALAAALLPAARNTLLALVVGCVGCVALTCGRDLLGRRRPAPGMRKGARL